MWTSVNGIIQQTSCLSNGAQSSLISRIKQFDLFVNFKVPFGFGPRLISGVCFRLASFLHKEQTKTISIKPIKCGLTYDLVTMFFYARIERE